MTILYLTMSSIISLMRSVRELRMSWEAERWKTHARLKLQGGYAWPSGLAAPQGVPSKWVPLRWFLYPNGSGNWDRSAMGGAGGLAPAQSQPCRTWSPGTEPNALEVWGGGIRSPKQCGQSRCTPTKHTIDETEDEMVSIAQGLEATSTPGHWTGKCKSQVAKLIENWCDLHHFARRGSLDRSFPD